MTHSCVTNVTDHFNDATFAEISEAPFLTLIIFLVKMMYPGTMTDMDAPVNHIGDGPQVSMTDPCVNNVVVNDTSVKHLAQGSYSGS